jgi:DNA polymerase III subunit epsilon
MLKLNLTRPLAVFDIESTGTNRKADRIIDLAVLKIAPGGAQTEHQYRVNPEMPIPPEATAVHGITDAAVKDCPTFKAVAPAVAKLLEDCDLAGFNVSSFDIPLLAEEFARAGVPFSTDGRYVLDAQRIFHRKHPRDLAAALQFYCGELHLEAHRAADDVRATFRVLAAQLERYEDLPRSMDKLDEFCHPRNPAWADRTGKLKWQNGELVINFGRFQGRSVRAMVSDETGFLNWMLKNDFPRDTQELVRNALSGRFPAPPSAAPAARADTDDAA